MSSQINNLFSEPLLLTTDPAKLSFQNDPENNTESRKRIEITNLISTNRISLEECLLLARSEYGLVSDDLRKIMWPILVDVDTSNMEIPPPIEELKLHSEYNQVVLDVNRSLKRFPPGIPYEQRIALQDQLTVLIMRIINKYPNLKYYQGYHDVAITFLLVVGEKVSFAVMEKLSLSHFEECMHETMDPVQRRLMYIYPIVNYENSELYCFLKKSSVGTLFALPWVLTWFGHSLKSYKCVVRLYDYFLASPMYFVIYVTAAIILFRSKEILNEDCDMASIHCLLSQLPDELPFEQLLKAAEILYDKYPMSKIEKDVDKMIQNELDERKRDEERSTAARKKLTNDHRFKKAIVSNIIPTFLLRKSFIVTTTFSIIFGICAYYYKNQYWSSSLPDELPFEQLLKAAEILYDKYPMSKIEKDVDKMIQNELDERKRDEERSTAARKKLTNDHRFKKAIVSNIIPTFLLRKSFIVTTTFSIIFGICAYYYKNQYWSSSVS